MNALIAFVNAFFGLLYTALSWILDGCLYVIKTAVYFIFDGLLTVLTSTLQAIDFSAYLSTFALSWAGVPSQLIWCVNSIGVPQGLALIAGAIVIRLLINLIPGVFTRV